ncbi:hypothetical protein ACEF11_10685 [[Pasteurella] aerogenes]|nr:hypothetical protein [[Pasteurella] aerogenes]
MFREEIEIIAWLAKSFISAIILFIIIPILILLILAGVITGIIWKVILGMLAVYLIFLSIAKIVLHILNKKWEREYQQKIQKENEVKYIIIK